MQHDDYCYVDTATNGATNRNQIKLVTKYKPAGQKDCYKTYFRYRQEMEQHVKLTGSVKAFEGMAYADYFPIDIDSDNLDEALTMTIELINRIEVNFDLDRGCIPVFFSGAKGFHVYLSSKLMEVSPSKNIAQIFKAFAKDMMSQWPLKYDSTIYDTVRLFRVAGTINSKSGLYKIPLSHGELIGLSIEEIKVLARVPRTVDFDTDVDKNETLSAMYANATEQINQKPVVRGCVTEGQTTPKNGKQCYHSLLRGVGDGERDLAAFRLAAHYFKEGFPSDLTEGLLQSWNNHNTPPMEPEEITNKVSSAYGNNARNDFGCNDELLQKHCSDSCYLKTKAVLKPSEGAEVVFNIDDAELKYRNYTNDLKTRLIKINFPGIGEAMRGIAPGEVCTVLARSGVGKTATLMNILLRVGLSNKSPQMFFTMEQPIPQIYERMAQIAIGIKGRTIEDAYCDKTTEREIIKEKTKALFGHVWLVEKCGLNVEEIRDVVLQAQSNRIGEKVNLVAIDYLNLIGGKGESYERVSGIIKRVKEISKELDVAIIILAQVNRTGGDGSQEVEMDMARDSGAVEESSDFIMGLWRPDIKEKVGETEEVMRVKLLKNKKGKSGINCDLKFVKPYLRLDDYGQTMWVDEKDAWRKNGKIDINELGREVVVDCPF